MNNKNITTITLLLIISILVGIFNIIITFSNQSNFTNKYLETEYKNYWWKENYEKVMLLQSAQIKSQFWKLTKKEIEEQISKVDKNLLPENQKQDIKNKINISSLAEKRYILWDENAKLTFLEFSDLDCPFCKELHTSWVKDRALEEYDWKLNYSFRHFPLDTHRNAKMKSNAALCLWELTNDSKKYNDFISKIFSSKWANTKEEIAELWVEFWVWKNEMLSCIDSEKFNSSIDKEIEEWIKLFSITWTPGSIIINNETWEYKAIKWSASYETFKSTIDSLLK